MQKLALVVSAFLVSAQAPYVPTAPQVPILNVEITVTTQGGGKPAFYGTTNLPDGLGALAKLRETGSLASADEESFVVHAHHFTAGPFSQGGNPLPSGTYIFFQLLNGEIVSLREQFERGMGRLQQAEAGRETAEARGDELRDRLDDLGGKLDGAQAELAAAQDQVEALTQAEAERRARGFLARLSAALRGE